MVARRQAYRLTVADMEIFFHVRGNVSWLEDQGQLTPVCPIDSYTRYATVNRQKYQSMAEIINFVAIATLGHTWTHTVFCLLWSVTLQR